MSVNNQRGLGNVRAWNSQFPPGTEVDYCGELRKTWGPAGLGPKGEPSVWLVGIEPLVPLNLLKVPGWKRCKR